MPVLDDLSKARIVTVGDAILDRWVYGRVERLSPEGPFPILVQEEIVEQPGGAANVSANLTALGITGYANTLISDAGNSHLVKVRYVDRASGRQLLRVDDEKIVPLTEIGKADVLKALMACTSAQCVVLSDYGKGMLHPWVCHHAIVWAQNKGIPVVVDPKGDDWSKYHGATIITPNERESEEVRTSSNDFGITVLKTLGAKGMLLMEPRRAPVEIPAQAKEVFDVTGAGDTTVAVLAAALAVGFELLQAAYLANAAAGVVVGKRGTATCSLDELREATRGML